MKQETLDKLNEYYILCREYREWLLEQPSLLVAWENLYEKDKKNFIESFRLLGNKGQKEVNQVILSTIGTFRPLKNRLKYFLWNSYISKIDAIDGQARVAENLKQRWQGRIVNILKRAGFTEEEIYGQDR